MSKASLKKGPFVKMADELIAKAGDRRSFRSEAAALAFLREVAAMIRSDLYERTWRCTNEGCDGKGDFSYDDLTEIVVNGDATCPCCEKCGDELG